MMPVSIFEYCSGYILQQEYKENHISQKSQKNAFSLLTIHPFYSPIKDKKTAMVAGVVRPEQQKRAGSVGYEGNSEVS